VTATRGSTYRVLERVAVVCYLSSGAELHDGSLSAENERGFTYRGFSCVHRLQRAVTLQCVSTDCRGQLHYSVCPQTAEGSYITVCVHRHRGLHNFLNYFRFWFGNCVRPDEGSLVTAETCCLHWCKFVSINSCVGRLFGLYCYCVLLYSGVGSFRIEIVRTVVQIPWWLYQTDKHFFFAA
jgi:hypothetical protein